MKSHSTKLITWNNLLSTSDAISVAHILIFWTLGILGLVRFGMKLHSTCSTFET